MGTDPQTLLDYARNEIFHTIFANKTCGTVRNEIQRRLLETIPFLSVPKHNQTSQTTLQTSPKRSHIRGVWKIRLEEADREDAAGTGGRDVDNSGTGPIGDNRRHQSRIDNGNRHGVFHNSVA